MSNKTKVIVATIAFALGINKPDVRFVIHTNIPKTLDTYIQETGWAGRDWQYSECIFAYKFKDISEHDFFIHSVEDEDRWAHNFKNLFKVVDYAEEQFICWWKQLLAYLGEEFKEEDCK